MAEKKEVKRCRQSIALSNLKNFYLVAAHLELTSQNQRVC
jgi:hypothetical protein